ncbi:MAG: hypothetical protein OQK12_13180 [Motiliproteus sp.]|nr:hypothetical protein [Motiliproteus sp.]MCW9051779.1 hypothetical protein [Motiliproteus sp.]
MGNTLWFINLLRDHPVVGFMIGLVFAAVMFGSKNLIVYLYSKRKQTKDQNKQRPDPLSKT